MSPDLVAFGCLITLTEVCECSQRKQDSKAQAPRFPKPKDEGWFLVLGEVEKRELLAIKRVGYVRNCNVASLAFYTPEQTGR